MIKTDEDFFKVMTNIVEWNWDRIVTKIDTSKLKTVVDVGSGVAIFDLLLSQCTDANFYLVDKSALDKFFPVQYSADKHGFYNSWNVVTDAITTSNLDPARFNFVSPTDEWPEQIDMIVSMHSWCWHYPKDNYWSKAIANLKSGGYLVLDILNLADRDTAQEITDELKANPISVVPLTPRPNHPFSTSHVMKNGSHGSTYIWVKP